MKKKLLFTVAMVVMSITFTNAQELRFALKTGANFGAFTWDINDGNSIESWNYSPQFGFYIGARGEYGLTQRMSIQGEVFYQMTRALDDETFKDDNQQYELTYNDLSIPIVFKFYLIPQKLSINAGISLGILLSATETGYDMDWNSVGWDADLKNGNSDDSAYGKVPMLTSLNFGVSSGIEYRVTDNLFVDFRYNLGLSDLANVENEFAQESIIQVSAIQIGGGWRF